MFHEFFLIDCNIREEIIVLGDLRVRDLATYSRVSKAANAYIFQWARAVQAEHTTPSIWFLPTLWKRSFSYYKDLDRHMEKCCFHRARCSSITLRVADGLAHSYEPRFFIPGNIERATKGADHIDSMRIDIRSEFFCDFIKPDEMINTFLSNTPNIKIHFLSTKLSQLTPPTLKLLGEVQGRLKEKYGDKISFEKID